MNLWRTIWDILVLVMISPEYFSNCFLFSHLLLVKTHSSRFRYLVHTLNDLWKYSVVILTEREKRILGLVNYFFFPAWYIWLGTGSQPKLLAKLSTKLYMNLCKTLASFATMPCVKILAWHRMRFDRLAKFQVHILAAQNLTNSRILKLFFENCICKFQLQPFH